jgi:hypothetical protein
MLSPSLHNSPPLIEKVRPVIGSLRLVLDRVRQRTLGQVTWVNCFLMPNLETKTESHARWQHAPCRCFVPLDLAETWSAPYRSTRGHAACRVTLTALGEQRCPTPEAFKAWSQNLGHDHVLTTLTSYGAVSAARQAEILNAMRGEEAGTGAEPDPETVLKVVAHLMKKAS